MRTVLITGGSGLLGGALRREFADWNVIAPPSAALDVTRADAMEDAIAGAAPDIVIHSATLTAVDECETHPEKAYRVNARSCEYLARSCERRGTRLIVVSTDYVFSGDSAVPYSEYDDPGPRTVYGASKLAGEEAALHLCPGSAVARVAWLFGPARPSFIDFLMARGRQGAKVRVATDQRSTPTSTRSAARLIRELALSPHGGIVHVTSEGGASRYELAEAVFTLGRLYGEPEPCLMSEFPSPARRPHNSELENRRIAELGLSPMPSWRDELAIYLHETYDV